MKENPFRVALCTALKRHYGARIYIQKNHGSAFSAGLPDLQICLDGHWFAWELKATPDDRVPKGAVTKLQRFTMGEIVAAGGNAAVVAWCGGCIGVWDVAGIDGPDDALVQATATHWGPWADVQKFPTSMTALFLRLTDAAARRPTWSPL